LVYHVVVVEGSVCVKNEALHFRVFLVEPLLGLVNKTTTVDEDETSHLF